MGAGPRPLPTLDFRSREPTHAARRRWGLAIAALAAMASGAAAQDAPGRLDGLFETLDLKAKLAPAPDFVTRSRSPSKAGFIPIGPPPDARASKVLTPAEAATAEADLDRARERQQRRAGQKPAAVPLKPPKGTAAKDMVR